MLLRQWWRFYDPRVRATEKWELLPRFRMIIVSVDTPLKDKESSDNVAMQTYGIAGADRYMLNLRIGKMNFASAKRMIRDEWNWVRTTSRFRGVPIYVLVENAGYGVELITDLKREITGVTKISPGAEGNKVARAEAASDALESGNIFLPGYGPPWQPVYDETLSPDEIRQFINNCALFPNASHDDDVDAWSQCQNWLRARSHAPIRTSSALARR